MGQKACLRAFLASILKSVRFWDNHHVFMHSVLKTNMQKPNPGYLEGLLGSKKSNKKNFFG